MARVTVHHLTLPMRLPIIEEQGLRTRADMSGLLGPLDELDVAAPGVFANGRRVSGYLDLDRARAAVDEHGPGHVSFTVDPAKAIAAPASARSGDPAAYWVGARPLRDWLADGDVPGDLEVHVNVAVRAKFLQMCAPLAADAEYGRWAPIVTAVADADRVSAKALMHLAIVASGGDFDSPEFLAACALAWRDEPDPRTLARELAETGHDRIASAALAEYGGASPELVVELREMLDETREWGEENNLAPGPALLRRTALILNEIPTA